jgi:DNA primase
LIPDSFIERLRDSADIERIVSSYVALKRRGRILTGCCPFHSEKTPSFTVYTDSDPHFYCFGCQKGGDVITFIREIENLEYVEAVKFLAEKAGLTVPDEGADDGSSRRKARVLEINRAAAKFFYERLISPQGEAGLKYLSGRGLTQKTIRRFGLGYSPDSWDALSGHLKSQGFSEDELILAAVAARGRNGRLYDQFRGRVIFPIIDLRGNVVGFGGRALSDKGPKYLNSSDTPVFKKSHNLYALNFAKAAKPDRLLLAEGYMDVISLHQAGFVNAVATLGTALTQEQARLISRYAGEAVLCYDSDSAGQKAARRAINIFSGLSVEVRVPDMQGAKDPDEYIQKFGPQRFLSLIEAGKSALTWEVEKLKAAHGLDSPEGQTAFLNDFCKLMAEVGTALQREVYVSQISRELGVGRERISAAVEAARKRRAGAAERKSAHNLRAYVQDNRTGQPFARSQVELSAAVAERGLISILMQNPDYYDDIRSKITVGDFISPDHAAIFGAICALLEERRVPELIHLSGRLDTKEIARLSEIMSLGRDIRFYKEQAPEFIAAIKAARLKKSPEELGKMTPEELKDYINEQRSRKF